jgi:superoxide dismutase, Cu-Zn family
MNSRHKVALAAAGMVAIGLAIASTPTAQAAASQIRAEGAFGETAGAYSYNAAFVPVGSSARVQAVSTASGKTIVTLHVWGLVPNREYGAHAHKLACGSDPAAASGHFQYVVGGASDPAFANEDNEIWLDFTTDEFGNGSAQTVLDWQFPADRRAQSVVLHDHHTDHGTPGTAGTAGPRYGCLTVGF